MKFAFLIGAVLLLAAWTHGGAGIVLTDNTGISLTDDLGAVLTK